MPSILSDEEEIESPAPAANFFALDGIEDFPPDTHGAIGQDYVMTMLNTRVSVQTKGGITIMTNTLNEFWGYSNAPSVETVFDPRMTYDPFNQRWIAVAATFSGSTNSEIVVAVSLTSNPTNGWNIVRQRADPAGVYWADSPTIGFNKDWIVAQAKHGKDK